MCIRDRFFTGQEVLDLNRFKAVGVIRNNPAFDEAQLTRFVKTITGFRAGRKWSRHDLVELFNSMIPEFHHKETGKFLDGKM